MDVQKHGTGKRERQALRTRAGGGGPGNDRVAGRGRLQGMKSDRSLDGSGGGSVEKTGKAAEGRGHGTHNMRADAILVGSE